MPYADGDSKTQLDIYAVCLHGKCSPLSRSSCGIVYLQEVVVGFVADMFSPRPLSRGKLKLNSTGNEKGSAQSSPETPSRLC